MSKMSLFVVFFAVVLMLALPLMAQEKSGEKTSEETMKMEKAGNKGSGIELVEAEPFYYCAVEMTGSYEQHSTAFMTLYTEAGKQGLTMAEAPFGIYWNSPQDTPEEALKWAIGMPVPEDKEIQEPLKKIKWEHTLLVTKGFEGAFESEDMYAAYAEVFEWIEKNGYEPAGPMLEKFLNTPSPNEAGETIGKVEIIIPVQKAKK
jgi:effector-binding domain-containing protein